MFVYPQKVSLTFATSPTGLAITIDGVNTSTPYVKDTLTGFQHTIGAPGQAQGGSPTASSRGPTAAPRPMRSPRKRRRRPTPPRSSRPRHRISYGRHGLTGPLQWKRGIPGSDNNVYHAVTRRRPGPERPPGTAPSPRCRRPSRASGSTTREQLAQLHADAGDLELDVERLGAARLPHRRPTEIALNNLPPSGPLAAT